MLATRYGGWSIQIGSSPPKNQDDKDAGGRASLSWGAESFSQEGHVLEDRRLDLETGMWWSCCSELKPLSFIPHKPGGADAFQTAPGST